MESSDCGRVIAAERMGFSDMASYFSWVNQSSGLSVDERIGLVFAHCRGLQEEVRQLRLEVDRLGARVGNGNE